MQAVGLQVNRLTATKYLDKVVDAGLIKKVKYWKTNYYLNMPLCELFMSVSQIQEMSAEDIIESVSENFII